MKNILFVMAIIIIATSCGDRKNKKVENSLVLDGYKDKLIVQVDSVKIIAEIFLWYNKFATPKTYEIEEPDLNNFFIKNKKLSAKYLPLILDEYDLTLPRKILIYCYLYKLGDTKYMKELCAKNLKGIDSLAFEQYISNFKINPCEDNVKL